MALSNLPPIICVAGKPRVGKTTLLVHLIAELRRRGCRIGVIKHSVHPFDMAQAGKDTWKHAQAGAEAVAFASARELVLTRSLEAEMDIDTIAAMLGQVDLVLAEGYKRAHKFKIEVSRRELGTDLVCPPQDLIAVVSDHPIALDVPRFDLGDVAGLADLIEQRFLL